jgi:ATP-dependent DNA ligase
VLLYVKPQALHLNSSGALTGTYILQFERESYSRAFVCSETGDLGDAAQRFKSKQQLLVNPGPLTVRDVYKTLREVCAQSGDGSEGRKKALLVRLMRACRGAELRYIVRTLVQHIRTGATLTSVLAALSVAAELHRLHPQAQPGAQVSFGKFAWESVYLDKLACRASRTQRF